MISMSALLGVSPPKAAPEAADGLPTDAFGPLAYGSQPAVAVPISGVVDVGARVRDVEAGHVPMPDPLLAFGWSTPLPR